MSWEQILTLLHIAHMANEYGNLTPLRNAAIAELQAVDTNNLHFASQVDGQEPLEDE